MIITAAVPGRTLLLLEEEECGDNEVGNARRKVETVEVYSRTTLSNKAATTRYGY